MTSIEMNLRYQKQGLYNDDIFIVSRKINEEKEAFEKLKKLEKKLEEMDLGTFLPVYHNGDLGYCTIRFKFYRGQKLVERNVYSVKFDVKKSTRGDQQYINCFISGIKLHKKATPQDEGEVLDLGI